MNGTTGTLGKIEKALCEIEDAIDDPEAAHTIEDKMYQDVLEAIAGGVIDHPDCVPLTSEEMAALALRALASQRIEFPRWCA